MIFKINYKLNILKKKFEKKITKTVNFFKKRNINLVNLLIFIGESITI